MTSSASGRPLGTGDHSPNHLPRLHHRPGWYSVFDNAASGRLKLSRRFVRLNTTQVFVNNNDGAVGFAPHGDGDLSKYRRWNPDFVWRITHSFTFGFPFISRLMDYSSVSGRGFFCSWFANANVAKR